jgi:GNAT superfamily N-acetyltransferase
LIIRPFDKKDINQLIKMRFDFTAEYKELDQDLFESFSEECRLFFEEMFLSNRWVAWVAEVDDRIVSHVFVEIIDTIPRPGRKNSPYGYVTNVYTTPEYRSMGIGSKIMEEVNRWANENELTFLMVWPSETSVDFYERHGFSKAKEVMENHLKN